MYCDTVSLFSFLTCTQVFNLDITKKHAIYYLNEGIRHLNSIVSQRYTKMLFVITLTIDNDTLKIQFIVPVEHLEK
jgi:hypothetical protein